jgi:hypothetical protein
MGELPDDIKTLRLGVAMLVFYGQLAARAQEIEHGAAPRLADEVFRDELISMISAILAAPYRGAPAAEGA